MNHAELIKRYNALLESSNNAVLAQINLVNYLHANGMKLKDIYAIAEAPLSGKAAA